MNEERLTKSINSQREFLKDVQSLQSYLLTIRMILYKVLRQQGKVRIRAPAGMREYTAHELVDSFPNLELTFSDRLIVHKVSIVKE